MSDIIDPNTNAPNTLNFRGVPQGVIFSKLLELRRKLGGLRAKEQKGGPRFPIKSSKELMEKLRTAVDELGLVVAVTEQEIHPVQTESGTCCYVRCTVAVIAEDGSTVHFSGVGGGMDRDDKAAGKASTYAWKDALLKGLSIPDKEMVDADDEEGQGKEVRPGAPKRSGAGGKDPEAAALAAIQSAESVEALEALKELLKRMPPDAQARLSPAYAARRASLGGGK